MSDRRWKWREPRRGSMRQRNSARPIAIVDSRKVDVHPDQQASLTLLAAKNSILDVVGFLLQKDAAANCAAIPMRTAKSSVTFVLRRNCRCRCGVPGRGRRSAGPRIRDTLVDGGPIAAHRPRCDCDWRTRRDRSPTWPVAQHANRAVVLAAPTCVVHRLLRASSPSATGARSLVDRHGTAIRSGAWKTCGRIGAGSETRAQRQEQPLDEDYCGMMRMTIGSALISADSPPALPARADA